LVAGNILFAPTPKKALPKKKTDYRHYRALQRDFNQFVIAGILPDSGKTTSLTICAGWWEKVEEDQGNIWLLPGLGALYLDRQITALN
jgi:hypothetical protein